MASTNSTNVTQEIYEKVKSMIFEYKIVPGQRLIFNDLATKLSVSRTPVNIALSLLSKDGLLDLVPKVGYRVHELSREEADSLIELRLMLELGSLEKILKKLTKKQIKLIKQKKDLYEEAALKVVNRSTFFLNEDFHASYLEVADNLFLVKYYREINQRVFVHHRVEGYSIERTRKVISEHNSIFDALCECDPVKFTSAIREHVLAGKEYILTLHS